MGKMEIITALISLNAGQTLKAGPGPMTHWKEGAGAKSRKNKALKYSSKCLPDKNSEE